MQIKLHGDIKQNRPEVFLEKVFRKYAANLQVNTHAEVGFQ